jgi:hypothetical protein
MVICQRFTYIIRENKYSGVSKPISYYNVDLEFNLIQHLRSS